MWGPQIDRKGFLGGTAADARPFPVTLRAGHEISLWVYVTQPNCSADSIPFGFDAIPLRWSALGMHHVYWLSLTAGMFRPITLCPPHSALKYIDHG
jgi:hypothetical protein